MHLLNVRGIGVLSIILSFALLLLVTTPTRAMALEALDESYEETDDSALLDQGVLQVVEEELVTEYDDTQYQETEYNRKDYEEKEYGEYDDDDYDDYDEEYEDEEALLYKTQYVNGSWDDDSHKDKNKWYGKDYEKENSNKHRNGKSYGGYDRKPTLDIHLPKWEDNKIYKGEYLKLHAVAKGGDYPLSQIDWKCNTQPLTTHTGNTLYFTSWKEGTYTCQARVRDNDGDVAKDSVQVIVQKKQTSYPVVTVVTPHDDDDKVKVGEKILLLAIVKGGEKPLSKVSWGCTNGQTGYGNTLQFVNNQPGSYNCHALVSDNNGYKASNYVTITVVQKQYNSYNNHHDWNNDDDDDKHDAKYAGWSNNNYKGEKDDSWEKNHEWNNNHEWDKDQKWDKRDDHEYRDSEWNKDDRKSDHKEYGKEYVKWTKYDDNHNDDNHKSWKNQDDNSLDKDDSWGKSHHDWDNHSKDYGHDKVKSEKPQYKEYGDNNSYKNGKDFDWSYFNKPTKPHKKDVEVNRGYGGYEKDHHSDYSKSYKKDYSNKDHYEKCELYTYQTDYNSKSWNRDCDDHKVRRVENRHHDTKCSCDKVTKNQHNEYDHGRKHAKVTKNKPFVKESLKYHHHMKQLVKKMHYQNDWDWDRDDHDDYTPFQMTYLHKRMSDDMNMWSKMMKHKQNGHEAMNFAYLC